MVTEEISVGLVIERWLANSQWGSITWRPSIVFPTAPDVAAWTSLGNTATTRLYYAGEQTINLYSTETANYIDNLSTGSPRLWVVLRPSGDEPPVGVVAVTADPSEGEAFTEPGSDVVETVPMPAEVAAAIARFIAAHHVERVFEKRKRGGGPAKGTPSTGLDRGPPVALKRDGDR